MSEPMAEGTTIEAERNRLFAQADRAHRRLREDGDDCNEAGVEREKIENAQVDGFGDEDG